MVAIRPASEAAAAAPSFDVLVIGAGGCGLCAAMAARDHGASVCVLERDAEPVGNTSWSVGMIPAAASKVQQAKGVEDSPALFAADIMAKTKGKTDPDMALRLAERSGPTLDWLMERHGLKLDLLQDILYPGHSRHRYHVPPSITGGELQEMMLTAAKTAGAQILTSHRAEDLYADDDRRVVAVGGVRANGEAWTIGCKTLVLATDGFAANPDLVAAHIPEMASAISFGHHGAQGDSLMWGQALGAASADLGAYQGHNIVFPERMQLTWAVIIDGGVQVNLEGRRFDNEMRGYSEQAADILRQPQGVAWNIFDQRCERNAMLLETYRTVADSGALVRADSVEALSAATGLPLAMLAQTLEEVALFASGLRVDPLGRDFSRNPPLRAPYVAARVTGALYHTQGGLRVDSNGRVLGADGSPFPNLFAGGGAARGVSGPSAFGYLGGNGLLCAVVLGKLAGDGAAAAAGF